MTSTTATKLVNDDDDNYNIYGSIDGTRYRHSAMPVYCGVDTAVDSSNNGGIEWHANIDGSMERHGSIDRRTDQHDSDTNPHCSFKLAMNSNGRCSDENQAEKERNETIYHNGINTNEVDISCYCNPGDSYCYGLQSSLIFPRKCFTFRERDIYGFNGTATTAYQYQQLRIR